MERIIRRSVKYALLGLTASVVLALLFVGIEVATEAFWGWHYEFDVAQRFLISFLTSAFLMVLFSTFSIVLSELTDRQE